jgi:hypothetical protein
MIAVAVPGILSAPIFRADGQAVTLRAAFPERGLCRVVCARTRHYENLCLAYDMSVASRAFAAILAGHYRGFGLGLRGISATAGQNRRGVPALSSGIEAVLWVVSFLAFPSLRT